MMNMNDAIAKLLEESNNLRKKHTSLSSSRLKHQHRLTTNALAPILSILMQGDVTIDVYIFAIVVDADDKERRQHIPDSWQGRVRHIPDGPTVGPTSFMETLETSGSNYQLKADIICDISAAQRHALIFTFCKRLSGFISGDHRYGLALTPQCPHPSVDGFPRSFSPSLVTQKALVPSDSPPQSFLHRSARKGGQFHCSEGRPSIHEIF